MGQNIRTSPKDMAEVRRILQRLQTKAIGGLGDLASLDSLAMTELSDVDGEDTPAINDVPMWDGTEFVFVPADSDLSFSIASFTDGLATSALIGSGVWKAIGAITFEATYNNGPPTSAVVSCASWGAGLTMTGDGEGPTASTSATNYPGSVGTSITFTLTADEETDTESVIFYNAVRWGVTAKADTFSDADIDDLAGTATQAAITYSGFTAAPGAAEYVLYAHRNAGGTIAQFLCGTGVNQITAAFDPADATAVTPDYETVSHSNANGFTEDFKVYRSKLQNLDAHSGTLTASSSGTAVNYIFWGVLAKEDTFTESDVESLADKTSSNTAGREFTVTPGAGEYIIYALPTRLGEVTFWVGGFEGGFQAAETVAVTNPAGFEEDYYVYRSTNSNLGETTVTTESA